MGLKNNLQLWQSNSRSKHQCPELEKRSTLLDTKGTLKPTLTIPVAEWEIMVENIWKRLITQGRHQNYLRSLEVEKLFLLYLGITEVLQGKSEEGLLALTVALWIWRGGDHYYCGQLSSFRKAY